MNVVQDNVVISNNGLHYGYTTDDGTNYSIYLGNKLVKGDLSDSNTLYLDGVSDNGQDYMYSFTDSSGHDALYKSGINEYTSNGSLQANTSNYTTVSSNSDLSKYIGLVTSSGTNVTTHGSVYSSTCPTLLNGYLVNTQSNVDQAEYGISSNGKHYYVSRWYIYSHSRNNTHNKITNKFLSFDEHIYE